MLRVDFILSEKTLGISIVCALYFSDRFEVLEQLCVVLRQFKVNGYKAKLPASVALKIWCGAGKLSMAMGGREHAMMHKGSGLHCTDCIERRSSKS
jgi:hypothetical protein